MDRQAESDSSSVMKINRRRFLKVGVYATALAGLGAVGAHGYGGVYGSEDITVERVAIPIPHLKQSLEGLRIVQMSDFHLHPFTTIELIERAIDSANRLKPDLLVLTGDYITQKVDAIFELCKVLGKLSSRLGVFAVLGNHDAAHAPKTVRENLEKVGVTVLRNRGIELSAGKDALFLAGLDDVRYGKPNLTEALRRHRDTLPTLLLVHEPDYADQVADTGRVTLQLSGHSHGGQVRLPGIGALYLPSMGRKYDQGLYRIKEAWLYTNRGIGVVNVPVRFACPPEVTEITLCADSVPQGATEAIS
jgi:predicted MPP superfamily phosphohydrolase